MAAKLKSKVRSWNVLLYCYILLLFTSLFIIIFYIGCKISQLNKYNTNSGYFASVDVIKALVGIEQKDEIPSFTKLAFYTAVWSLVIEDIIHLKTSLHTMVISLVEPVKINSIASSVFITTAVLVGITALLYARSHSDGKKPRKRNNSRKEKSSRPGNGACCHEAAPSTQIASKRVWWRWLTALMVLAFLLSLPWEFVRLYQSMVAESVAQMKTGTPVECMPEQMSMSQTVRAWLRWQFSWGEDPCLLYHKALLVDPIWQVPPLMVISSAFSHCVVYPIEVLFGGLGRAFRLFFAEIPMQWQPVMLIVLVTVLVLVLTMLFGYRIHLPFLIKFEPKTPVFFKLKRKRPVESADEKKTLNFSDDLTSSQESEYSLYTGTQSTQSQSIEY